MRPRDWWVLVSTGVLALTVAAGVWRESLGIVVAIVGAVLVWVGVDTLTRARRAIHPTATSKSRHPAGRGEAAVLVDLAAKVDRLPHAPACPGGRGCWCPLSDVADLLAERYATLTAPIQETRP